MSVYNLTGAGTVGLSANVSRLIVDVQTFDPNRTIGRATPPNYYDLGLLRFGVQGSYGITQPIDAASLFMDAPEGATTLGYTLFGVTAVRVTEQFASVPDLSTCVAQGQVAGTDSGTVYTVPAGSAFILKSWIVDSNQGNSWNATLWIHGHTNSSVRLQNLPSETAWEADVWDGWTVLNAGDGLSYSCSVSNSTYRISGDVVPSS